MRSVKKLLKKAMVFTLSAAMLVGTPLTASAAPLNSVYSIGDHWGDQWDDGDDSSHTGTVTNTATTTESGVLKDNETKIVGIALDKTHLNLEKGVQEELTATILFDADDKELVDKYGVEKTDELKKVLENMIRWEVQNADGKVDGTTNQTLSIRVSTAGDAKTVTLNPRRGTKVGKDMIVKAYLDGSWYIAPVKNEDGTIKKDENGKVVSEVKQLTDDYKTAGYSAQATVFIKEYSEGLTFVGVPEVTYVKHTLDLNEHLKRTPETANDDITWTSTNTKVATVTAAGMVTFKKANWADGAYTQTKGKDDTCEIKAISEKGKEATYTVKVEQGVAASKIVILESASATTALKSVELDLGSNGPASKDVVVKLYAKVKGAIKSNTNNKNAAETANDCKQKGNGYDTGTLEIENGKPYFVVGEDGQPKQCTLGITDVITWTTNKATIATVNGVTGANKENATIKAVGQAIGKATITAKASNGKSAKVTANVKATLGKLKIGGINPGDTLYSGQSVQLEAVRTPAANKDGVTWSIEKVTYTPASGGKEKKDVNNPNATINNKGVLTIKPKLESAVTEVKVNLVQKVKKGETAKSDSVTITIKQSNITSITVEDGTEVIAKLAPDSKNKNKLKANEGITKAVNTRKLSVPVGKDYTVTATADAGAAYDARTTLNVTTNKPKVATVTYDKNGTARVKAVAKGSATITVSGVANNKVVKTTFKVDVKQPVTSLTMNKPYVVLKDTRKALSASFSVKQNKDAKENITWSMTGTKSGDKNTKIEITQKGKVTFGKDSGYKAGDKFIVTAKSQSGVTATATIEIVSPSTAVRVVNKDGNEFTYQPSKGKPKANTTVLELGKSVELFPQVNVGGTGKGKSPVPAWISPSTFGTDDNSAKYAAGVTYSVNKKGIVQIVGNTVYRVGNGKAVITIKTTDGKSCKLTIEQ